MQYHSRRKSMVARCCSVAALAIALLLPVGSLESEPSPHALTAIAAADHDDVGRLGMPRDRADPGDVLVSHPLANGETAPMRRPAVDEPRSQVVGNDGRQRVNPTTATPWRGIVFLDINFPLASASCTGFMIGPQLIATAGHCVHSTANGGFATSVRVVPGKNGNQEPFGSQFGISSGASNGWINSRDPDNDFGVVTLSNTTLSSQVGIVPFTVASDTALLNTTVNLSGYPGSFGNAQWFDADQLTDPGSSILSYKVDTSSGQSGAPIWVYNGSSRAVVGIHTNGFFHPSCSVAGGDNNCGIRITSGVATSLENAGAAPRSANPSSPYVSETIPVSGQPAGLNFRLQSSPVTLSWSSGSGTTGTLPVRWGSISGNTFLFQNGAFLPSGQTTYTDNSALTDPTYCYLVVALGGNPPSTNNFQGLSDFLCVFPAAATGNAAQHVAIQLNQTNVARLSWNAPPSSGYTGYRVTRHSYTSGLDSIVNLSSGAISVEHLLSDGGAACFKLETMNGATVVGVAKQVCAVPGIFSFAASGTQVWPVADNLSAALQSIRLGPFSRER